MDETHASAEELVILVDEDDRPVGEAAKAECHRHPVPLHRAFSVFLFDERGRCLITKRSANKPTWPGHWSNACCSHPRPGEATDAAAARRVREELGITVDLRPLFSFRYEARYDDQWGEHEIDHVFVGRVEAETALAPDPHEVAGWSFVAPDDLRETLARAPERYTPWFLLSVERALEAD